MIQDVKILSLYKQHYFDSYKTEMECQYSCLGYYDGITVTEIDIQQGEYRSQLFEKKSNAYISPIWYGTVRESENLNGKFSKQSIGIFRCNSCETEKEEEKRCLKERSPYFAVAFIQLNQHDGFKTAAKRLESMSFVSDNPGNDEYGIVVPYYTYDNADIIALIYSNRMIQIEKILIEAEKCQEINYIHSVMGIAEEYLKACKREGAILPRWMGQDCFIGDKISQINLKIATSGNEKILHWFRGQLCQLEQSSFSMKKTAGFKYAHVLGHENIVVTIEESDVKSLLIMLIPGSLITHGNPLFGTEIYNIETSIIMRKQECTDIVEKVESDEKFFLFKKNNSRKEIKSDQQKFIKLVKHYQEKWESIKNNRMEDEGLYSYFCALIQLANTLAQYEGFSLAKDIFCLLYPPFELFNQELCDALTERDFEKANVYNTKLIEVKSAMCEFINAVNSVVYHTIHTDQIFLMIPGYSGTTFSIPSKLCLFYSNVIDNVIKILNDTRHTYRCLLTPELETRPETKLINVGGFDENRLIRFSFSQRSLFMPRHFMILLTHEIAHYVGDNIRNRQVRLQCLAKTLAYLLAEGVFPDELLLESMEYGPMEKEIYDIMYKAVKCRIQEKCVTKIYQKVKDSKVTANDHSTVIEDILKGICYELLEEKGYIRDWIYTMSQDMWEEAERCDLVDYAYRLSKIQNLLDQNRRKLFASQVILDTCVRELILVYKEVFSDIAAAVILRFDRQTFTEVFNVSEGYKANPEENGKAYDIQRIVRERILDRVIFKDTGDRRKGDEREEENREFIQKWPDPLKENLFSFNWTGKYLVDYAEVCVKDIRNRWETYGNAGDKAAEIFKALQEVRKMYDAFTNQEKSCEEIYEMLIDNISSYKRKVADGLENPEII